MRFEADLFFLPVQGNPRTTAILAVAKANGLELDFVHTEPAKGVSDDYRKLNKLGKVPTFEGADGYILSECIAIAIYRQYLRHPLCPLTAQTLPSRRPHDELYLSFSYPCLKTTVDNIHTLIDTTHNSLPLHNRGRRFFS